LGRLAGDQEVVFPFVDQATELMTGSRQPVGAVFLTLALVWVPAALSMARGRRAVSRAYVAVAAGGVLLLAVVLGRAQEVQYYNQHYTRTTPFLQDGGPRKAYTFARERHGARIGIAGSGEIFFGQYGFYGANLDNYVQYIGAEGSDGTYRLATTCHQFRRLINEGEYDFLITSKATQDSPEAEYWYPVYAWLKTDPALELVIEEPEITPQPDYVFKVTGKLDTSCADVGHEG
jgi:hypothetical protein